MYGDSPDRGRDAPGPAGETPALRLRSTSDHLQCRAMKKLAFLLLLTLALPLAAQIDPGMYGEMRWRMIGPFRGGRQVAGVGVAQQPNAFYMGVNNCGGWRPQTLRPRWDAE